ncbi:hypothetical protein B0O99DRAFT_611343 [Bisporella sp. PMI_857]|nr:hypothetical protein B0O99DRAFT_611343 [Bisporella sp. PMI_857]
MSTTTPPASAISPNDTAKIIHNLAIGAVIVCPIIIAIPPRKLDFYTIALLGGTFAGGNQLCREYTGRSILKRCQDRLARASNPLPEKARIMQEQLRREKERRYDESLRGPRNTEEPQSRILEELGRKEKSVIEKIWLGGEGDDWKKKRDEREKRYLEEGKGYGDLIKDQIWDVWSWRKDKAEEVKEKDEEILEKRKPEKQGQEKK